MPWGAERPPMPNPPPIRRARICEFTRTILELKHVRAIMFAMQQNREMSILDDRHYALVDILCLANRLSREIDALAVGFGEGALSGINARILVWLTAQGEAEICQRDIEEAFAIRRSTVSRILRLMEEKGLIVREAVASDARLKRVRLTEQARQTCAQSTCRMTALERLATKSLDDGEVSQLRSLLARIDGALTR